MRLNPQTGLYEVKIDGLTFEFEKWGAEESLDTLLDIAKVVGQPIGQAASALMGKDGESALDKQVDPNFLGTILDSLTSKMDKRLVKDLIKKCSSEKVFVDGKPIEFNKFYSEKLALSFKVTKACLEVQYGNFFAALLDLLPDVKRRTNQALQAM